MNIGETTLNVHPADCKIYLGNFWFSLQWNSLYIPRNMSCKYFLKMMHYITSNTHHPAWKKKEYCPQLKLHGYPPLSWPGKEAYILSLEPTNMNISKTAKESKWRHWKGIGWGFIERFFLKDCRGVFVYSDHGPLGRLAGVILLTLTTVCYTLMSFAFFPQQNSSPMVILPKQAG